MFRRPRRNRAKHAAVICREIGIWIKINFIQGHSLFMTDRIAQPAVFALSRRIASHRITAAQTTSSPHQFQPVRTKEFFSSGEEGGESSRRHRYGANREK
ncbi:hypothetical protein I7I50_04983 [Histoplasma capsulatum G186AR]|uniref:Uncharacterized protein n=1 Tax=Ajellomyces capsulatus TaxID=5037 RepID=A0A8H7Z919_AJECA|nr:hypothetical protein I7I52_03241 [Histoplasma capsulatum]QSS75740.1 hypothetical protein I7I50_04983 [Histoplasma capsulatum G186AR]